MYKDKKILAIIPARGETKQIFKKNIKLFNGYPLFTWILKSAINSEFIDDIIISTEDEQIIEISKEYGNFVPFKRDKALSKDNISLNNVILDTLNKLKEKELEYDYILTLLPTQPLIQNFHLDNIIKLSIDNNFSSSIGTLKESSNFIKILKDDKLINSSNDIYKINNSIFINKISEINPKLFNIYNNSYPFIIDKKYEGNIDSAIDWEISELKQLLLEFQNI